MADDGKTGWGCFPLAALVSLVLMVALAALVAVRVTPLLERGWDAARQQEGSAPAAASQPPSRNDQAAWAAKPDDDARDDTAAPVARGGEGPVATFQEKVVAPLTRALDDDGFGPDKGEAPADPASEAAIRDGAVLTPTRKALVKQLQSLSGSWRTVSNRLNNESGRYGKRYRAIPLSRLDTPEERVQKQADNQRWQAENRANEEKQKELRRLREVAKERLREFPRRAEIKYLTENEIRGLVARLKIPDNLMKYAVAAHKRKWHER